MGYIGVQPAKGQYRKLTDISSGFNGSATSFQLSVPPGGVNYYIIPSSPQQLMVSVGGIIQNPGVDYTTTGSQIIFTTAPAAGLSFFGTFLGDVGNGVSASGVDYIATGTGAVTRTTASKLGDVVSAKDFGAVGNGVTDDTAAIQSAINAAAGKALYFPAGTYLVSSTLTVSSETRLYGSNALGSILRTTSATANILTISNVPNAPGCCVEHLRFTSSVTRSAGSYIQSASAQGTTIKNCRFDGAWNAINITGSAVQGILIDNCSIQGALNRGILISASTSTGGPAMVGVVISKISNVLIAGASAGAQCPVGIEINCCGDLVLDWISTLYCATGLSVNPRSALSAGTAFKETIQALVISNSFFDTGTSYGMLIGGSGEVRLFRAKEVWCASFGIHGTVLSATGTILDSQFIDCYMASNTGSGISIATSTAANTAIIGGTYAGNGGSGIGVEPNVNNFRIQNATIGQTDSLNVAFPANTGYGILVSAGTSNNYIISGNTFNLNTAGNLFDGGTGTNKTIVGNTPSLGWFTYAPTVSLVSGAGNTVPVYTTNVGRWMSDGNGKTTVHVTLSGDGGAEGAGTGGIHIALPKTATSSASVFLTGIGRALNNATYYQMNGSVAAGATTIGLEYWSSISAPSLFTGNNQDNTSRSIQLAFTYESV